MVKRDRTSGEDDVMESEAGEPLEAQSKRSKTEHGNTGTLEAELAAEREEDDAASTVAVADETEVIVDVEDGDIGPVKRNRDEQLKFAVVCSSNMNRSMEAHKQFLRRNLDVYSYGVGQRIRLPGPNGQNVFEFGTSYQLIKDTLIAQGEEDWYRERGLLGMVERNIRIKDGPERFQECNIQEVARMDVVFCFEGRVFDLLIEDLEGREPKNFEPVHVLNLEVKDTPEEAEIGARVALELCEALQEKHDRLEESIAEVVRDIEDRYGRDIISKTCYI